LYKYGNLSIIKYIVIVIQIIWDKVPNKL